MSAGMLDPVREFVHRHEMRCLECACLELRCCYYVLFDIYCVDSYFAPQLQWQSDIRYETVSLLSVLADSSCTVFLFSLSRN
jgi:hypothetical protein